MPVYCIRVTNNPDSDSEASRVERRARSAVPEENEQQNDATEQKVEKHKRRRRKHKKEKKEAEQTEEKGEAPTKDDDNIRKTDAMTGDNVTSEKRRKIVVDLDDV